MGKLRFQSRPRIAHLRMLVLPKPFENYLVIYKPTRKWRSHLASVSWCAKHRPDFLGGQISWLYATELAPL